jgi:hypothetical protein
MIFLGGLVTGFLLNKQINKCLDWLATGTASNYLKIVDVVHGSPQKVFKNDIHKIELVFRIKSFEIFEKMFPKKVVPQLWEYYPKRKIIKLELNTNACVFNDSPFNLDVLDINHEHLITVDIPLLKNFSDLFIYIYYRIDNKEYINIYKEDSIIRNNDFNTLNVNETIDKVVCAKYDERYITNHFKKFINSPIKDVLTPGHICMDFSNNLEIELINLNSKKTYKMASLI